MTLTRIAFIIFLCISCGKDVKLSNKLESTQALSTKNFEKTGVLVKGDPSKLQVNGQNLEVSKYSSKQALDFLASFSNGTSVPVVFTGGTSSNQVILETIRRQ